MEQWIKDLEWVEGLSFDEPEEFEVLDGKLIQRKDIEEIDCSEYENNISGGVAYRFWERAIPEDLYEQIKCFTESYRDDTIMENQLDMMDAIADLYMAIESR